jgi:hypothetical protein
MLHVRRRTSAWSFQIRITFFNFFFFLKTSHSRAVLYLSHMIIVRRIFDIWWAICTVEASQDNCEAYLTFCESNDTLPRDYFTVNFESSSTSPLILLLVNAFIVNSLICNYICCNKRVFVHALLEVLILQMDDYRQQRTKQSLHLWRLMYVFMWWIPSRRVTLTKNNYIIKLVFDPARPFSIQKSNKVGNLFLIAYSGSFHVQRIHVVGGWERWVRVGI